MIDGTIEEWRSVKGYEDLYEVSNFGNVKSLPREVPFLIRRANPPYYTTRKVKGGIMTQQNVSGYKVVPMCSEGIEKSIKVHRLVAEAFIDNPKPNEYNIVHHKDHNKHNNNVSNLMWSDNQINTQEASKAGRLNPPKGDDRTDTVLTEDLALRVYTEFRDTDTTRAELSRKYSIKYSTLNNILSGNNYAHVTGGKPLKGKKARGTLTHEVVREIYNLTQQGYKDKELSEKFGVAFQTINKIRHQKHSYFKNKN